MKQTYIKPVAEVHQMLMDQSCMRQYSVNVVSPRIDKAIWKDKIETIETKAGFDEWMQEHPNVVWSKEQGGSLWDD